MKNSTSTLALLGAFILVPMSVALAAGPFNEAQARQKIEGAGYTQITGLHEDNNGQWTGDGTHDGKMMMFVLDTNGTITPSTNSMNANPAAAAATAGIQVQQLPAQVTVKQAQPDVTVTQGQPTITVHQPAPIVSIEVPQPEITVQMPKPQVAVSMAQPQVQVNQPKPQVQVVAAAPAQVDVQPSKPEVNTQQTQSAPVIHYTADQAKVNIKQSPGDPQVKVVDAGANAGAAANTGTSTNAPAVVPVVAAPVATAGQAPAANAGTNMLVSRVLNMNVTNMKGDVLGDIEHVVKNTDGKDYVVIGHGGFLGLGQKHVALPLDSMVLRNGKMEMRGLTDDQIRSMPSYNDNQPGYTDLQNTSSVQVSTAS